MPPADGEGPLEAATAARLARYRRGEDAPRLLALGRLVPGEAGMVQAIVLDVGATRTYRRNGGEGRLARVTLRDRSGEAEAVLWDDELDLVRDGVLAPGRVVRLRGVQARAGLRGGVELALGGAVVEAVDRHAARDAVLEAVEAEGDAVEAVLRVDGMRRRVRVAGALRAFLEHPPGTRLVVEGLAEHPVLEGRWVAGIGFNACVAPGP